MPSKKLTVVFQGCVNVAYRREGREWHATALEFDIVGYGKTRAAALQMLQELLTEYLQEVSRLLATGKKVKFFNPSESDAWNNNKSLETYSVRFNFTAHATARQGTQQGMAKLQEFIDTLGELGVDSIDEVELVAASA